MVRKDTNRHYSLRKLKKGTASVAVALTVVGAGLASQTEVKADNGRAIYERARERALQELGPVPRRLWLREYEKNQELTKKLTEFEEKLLQNDQLLSENTSKLNELKAEKAQVEEKLKEARLNYQDLAEVQTHIREKLEAEKAQVEEKLKEARLNYQDLAEVQTHIREKLEAEKAALETRKAELEKALEGAMNFSAEDSAKIKALEEDKAALEAEKAELEHQSQVLNANRQSLR
ncbi:TPA: YSIRK-type signal peptide-containing protein, partial [Streptococcus pyogenes]|nr:YSIRK-type signal peptide-containing protein [Streptococcus pyogenes]